MNEKIAWIKFSEEKPKEGQEILFLVEDMPFTTTDWCCAILQKTMNKIFHGVYSEEFYKTRFPKCSVEVWGRGIESSKIVWWMPVPLLPS